MKKVGFAITSSHCTIDPVLEQIIALMELGYEVIPIVSPAVINIDTRYGRGEDIKRVIEETTNHKVVSTIVEAEQFGPSNPLDALIIAPATGNSIAKLANGITDSPVLMATKATLRNGKPIIIGVSTNDGLSANGQNIMNLLNRKNIFFIPMGQDDYEKKPTSLIAHYDLTVPTVESAFEGKQYQPVLKEHVKTKKCT